jgi:hypothetical protein
MMNGNAVRQARFRDRQREDRAVFRVEVERDALIEALVSSGRLSPAEFLSRDCVENSLSRLIAEWVSER